MTESMQSGIINLIKFGKARLLTMVAAGVTSLALVWGMDEADTSLLVANVVLIAGGLIEMAISWTKKKANLEVQELLNKINSSAQIKVDGIVGPETKKAVRAAAVQSMKDPTGFANLFKNPAGNGG